MLHWLMEERHRTEVSHSFPLQNPNTLYFSVQWWLIFITLDVISLDLCDLVIRNTCKKIRNGKIHISQTKIMINKKVIWFDLI